MGMSATPAQLYSAQAAIEAETERLNERNISETIAEPIVSGGGTRHDETWNELWDQCTIQVAKMASEICRRQQHICAPHKPRFDRCARQTERVAANGLEEETWLRHADFKCTQHMQLLQWRVERSTPTEPQQEISQLETAQVRSQLAHLLAVARER